MPESALQHVCRPTTHLPYHCQADPAQYKQDVCSARQADPVQQRHEPTRSACSACGPTRSSPARAAAAQASRAIKQRACYCSISSPSAVRMPDAVLESQESRAESSLCSNLYSAADAVSTHVSQASAQRECCCDCGYVSRSPGSGTFKLGGRPASAGGCRAASPAACRPFSADVNEAGRVEGQRACASGLNGSLLSHSQGRAVASTPVLKEQQESKSPLSQLQRSFRAELGSPCSTAASLSGAVVGAGQGCLNNKTTPSNDDLHEGQAEIMHNAAAPHLLHQSASSDNQRRQHEVSPETSFLHMLDQCQSSATMLPASPRIQQLEPQLQQQQQMEALSFSIADIPACTGHAGSLVPQPVDLQGRQQGVSSLWRSFTAEPEAIGVAAHAEPASTAVTTRKTEAHSSCMTAGRSDSSWASSAAGRAAGRAERHNELCQLQAIAADKTQHTRSRPFAVASPDCELQLMLAFSACPASAMPAEPVTMTAWHAGSPALHASVPDDNSRRCRASRQAGINCSDTEHAELQASPVSTAQSVNSRGQFLPVSPADSGGSRQVGTSHSAAEQPVTQSLPQTAVSATSRSQDLPTSSAESGARQPQAHIVCAEKPERRDAGTDAMASSVETDHRQLLLGTAWVEQRQRIAARRQSGRMDAKWELDESGSDSGDSEGSVSTESTLRPSSVGRCRVNSGRHAKVLLQVCACQD